MNRKGQAALGIGIILTAFIAILVGVILFQAIAQQAGDSTTLATLNNYSLGTITNDTIYYFADYKSIADAVVTNTSDGARTAAGNYTITNNVIHPTTGALTCSFDVIAGYMHPVQTFSINGTAQPLAYVTSGGGRAVVGLIAIFFALAVAVIALTPTLRSGVLQMMGR